MSDTERCYHPAAVAGCTPIEIETFDSLAGDVADGPEPPMNQLAIHRLVQRGLFERDPQFPAVLDIPKHFMSAWVNWAVQQPGDPFGIVASRALHMATPRSAAEHAARLAKQCPGCGVPKQIPTVVCGACFKGGPLPLKDYPGSFEHWLEAISK